MLTHSWNHTNTQQRTDVRPHPPCILCCKHLYSLHSFPAMLTSTVNMHRLFDDIFFNYNIFNRFVYMKYSD